MSGELICASTDGDCTTCPAISKELGDVVRAKQSIEFSTMFASATIRALIKEGSVQGVEAAFQVMVEPETFTHYYGNPEDDVESLKLLADEVWPTARPQAQEAVRELAESVLFDRSFLEPAQQVVDLTRSGCPGTLHEQTGPGETQPYGADTFTCQSPLEGAGGTSVTIKRSQP